MIAYIRSFVPSKAQHPSSAACQDADVGSSEAPRATDQSITLQPKPGSQSSSMHELLISAGLNCSLSLDKARFLANATSSHGYNGQLDEVRDQEFARLAGHVYLDAAGAALYSEQQVAASAAELQSQLFFNPHRCGLGFAKWQCCTSLAHTPWWLHACRHARRHACVACHTRANSIKCLQLFKCAARIW